MNLGAASEPVSVQEEQAFGAYALDSNGHRTRLFGRYSAGPDRTLLLTTHAGLVLTRKERNHAQHAKVGNSAHNDSGTTGVVTPRTISITVVHTTHEAWSFDCNPVDAISSLSV